MNNRRRLAVHQPFGTDNLAAEGLADCLMAETYPQNRDKACKMLNDLQRDARLIRRAWARGQQQMIRLQPFDARDIDLVIAADLHLFAELPKYCTKLYVNES